MAHIVIGLHHEQATASSAERDDASTAHAPVTRAHLATLHIATGRPTAHTSLAHLVQCLVEPNWAAVHFGYSVFERVVPTDRAASRHGAVSSSIVATLLGRHR